MSQVTLVRNSAKQISPTAKNLGLATGCLEFRPSLVPLSKESRVQACEKFRVADQQSWVEMDNLRIRSSWQPKQPQRRFEILRVCALGVQHRIPLFVFDTISSSPIPRFKHNVDPDPNVCIIYTDDAIRGIAEVAPTPDSASAASAAAAAADTARHQQCSTRKDFCRWAAGRTSGRYDIRWII